MSYDITKFQARLFDEIIDITSIKQTEKHSNLIEIDFGSTIITTETNTDDYIKLTIDEMAVCNTNTDPLANPVQTMKIDTEMKGTLTLPNNESISELDDDERPYIKKINVEANKITVEFNVTVQPNKELEEGDTFVTYNGLPVGFVAPVAPPMLSPGVFDDVDAAPVAPPPVALSVVGQVPVVVDGDDAVDVDAPVDGVMPDVVPDVVPDVTVQPNESSDGAAGGVAGDVDAPVDVVPNTGSLVVVPDVVPPDVTVQPNESSDGAAGGVAGDTLIGEAGNDTLNGGEGNDTLNGEAGNDTLIGGAGDDELNGDAGNDTLIGEAGDDELNGEAGNDTLIGGAGDDELNGEAGNDILVGEAGDDTLNGGEGEDTLNGEAGDDFLYGGEGDDVATGKIVVVEAPKKKTMPKRHLQVQVRVAEVVLIAKSVKVSKGDPLRTAVKFQQNSQPGTGVSIESSSYRKMKFSELCRAIDILNGGIESGQINSAN